MNTKQKPACIQSEAIAAVAQQGVERALAARKHMVELSSKEVGDVSGGFYFSPIIYGMWSPSYFTPVAATLDINPSLDPTMNVNSLINIG